MSIRNDVLKELYTFAQNPKNTFDEIISENKDLLNNISTERLNDIYSLRLKSYKLCKIIPYSREEISFMVESKEVDPRKKVAELENYFNILESIFNEEKDNKL